MRELLPYLQARRITSEKWRYRKRSVWQPPSLLEPVSRRERGRGQAFDGEPARTIEPPAPSMRNAPTKPTCPKIQYLCPLSIVIPAVSRNGCADSATALSTRWNSPLSLRLALVGAGRCASAFPSASPGTHQTGSRFPPVAS